MTIHVFRDPYDSWVRFPFKPEFFQVSSFQLFKLKHLHCDDLHIILDPDCVSKTTAVPVLPLKYLLSMVHKEEFVTSSNPRWKNWSGNRLIISSRMFFIVVTVTPFSNKKIYTVFSRLNAWPRINAASTWSRRFFKVPALWHLFENGSLCY